MPLNDIEQEYLSSIELSRLAQKRYVRAIIRNKDGRVSDEELEFIVSENRPVHSRFVAAENALVAWLRERKNETP